MSAPRKETPLPGWVKWLLGIFGTLIVTTAMASGGMVVRHEAQLSAIEADIVTIKEDIREIKNMLWDSMNRQP